MAPEFNQRITQTRTGTTIPLGGLPGEELPPKNFGRYNKETTSPPAGKIFVDPNGQIDDNQAAEILLSWRQPSFYAVKSCSSSNDNHKQEPQAQKLPRKRQMSNLAQQTPSYPINSRSSTDNHGEEPTSAQQLLSSTISCPTKHKMAY
ncbi:hypothetical protein PCANC_11551 [Puccinia coronata f. sp. avenae]|uniref:Uncharacterized protein n=1 Tax=Puccinia coronata f. sp. avenae TaxID=200324 RepID=A0A2N5UQG7_9BASI|nr:hypothetical protein PCANC_11551 [Puccinia coronata f. sp. avenae]